MNFIDTKRTLNKNHTLWPPRSAQTKKYSKKYIYIFEILVCSRFQICFQKNLILAPFWTSNILLSACLESESFRRICFCVMPGAECSRFILVVPKIDFFLNRFGILSSQGFHILIWIYFYYIFLSELT